VGARTSNVDQLRDCTAALAERAPDAPKTITYEWALAVQEGRYGAARKLIERASSAGVAVDAMRQATLADEKRHWMRVLRDVAISVFLAVAAGLCVRAFLRRRKGGGEPAATAAG
jgi:hypothetical protein